MNFVRGIVLFTLVTVKAADENMHRSHFRPRTFSLSRIKAGNLSINPHGTRTVRYHCYSKVGAIGKLGRFSLDGIELKQQPTSCGRFTPLDHAKCEAVWARVWKPREVKICCRSRMSRAREKGSEGMTRHSRHHLSLFKYRNWANLTTPRIEATR